MPSSHSRLDYCNSFFYGLPLVQLAKLKRVQNAAARLVENTNRFCHKTPVLQELHWLPTKLRIHFKLLLLVYKHIYYLAPDYVCKLLTVKSQHRYNLRSTGEILLEYPKGRTLHSFGDRAFVSAAPKLWNALLPCLLGGISLGSFKSKLKTHFIFREAFTAL